MRTPLLHLVRLLALLAPTACFCQTASLNGLVLDPSGAAVPGADIRITETKTNAVRTILSGDSGSYQAPNLAPGDYPVTVEKTGFAKLE
jgi:hypothetical protein